MSSTNPDHIIKELKKHIKDNQIDVSSLECRMLLTMLENCVKDGSITTETITKELGV